MASGGSDRAPGGVPWFDEEVINNTILWTAGEEIESANEKMFKLQIPGGSAPGSNNAEDSDEDIDDDKDQVSVVQYQT